MSQRKLSPAELKKKLRKRKSSFRRKHLGALFGAAFALPGLGLSAASAQAVPDQIRFRFEYADYRDYQSSSENRMHIKAPLLWAEAPLGENDILEGSFSYDSMSGASPLYLNSLSGASGKGVEDIRRAGDLKYTHLFDRFSVAVGASVSDEDDFLSRGGLVEAKWWTEDKNTILHAGFGAIDDDISSTIDLTLSESRHTQNYIVGVTQVLDPNSIAQSNLSFTTASGYHSDPYKPLDLRPRSRDQFAWLNRYNRYFADFDGSLHADYRLYWDSWDVYSHTFEVAWYQAIAESWILKPSVRYYSQSSSDFFESAFPPTELTGFYSADQRLGDFGSFTTGIKVMRNIGSHFALTAGFDYMLQRPSFKLGGHNSEGIEDFYARFFSFGLLARF